MQRLERYWLSSLRLTQIPSSQLRYSIIKNQSKSLCKAYNAIGFRYFVWLKFQIPNSGTPSSRIILRAYAKTTMQMAFFISFDWLKNLLGERETFAKILSF